MNEQEKKKLAEWAGFKEKGTGYVWPDGRFDKAPDFPQSPDACIEHIVPKLNELGYKVKAYQMANNNWFVELLNPSRIGSPPHQADENFALALCLATEKLIKGGR